MIYLAISEYVESNLAEFALHKNLFINQAPNKPATLGLIRDNPGGIVIDGEMKTERAGSFQFIVRSDHYLTGYQMSIDVSALLTLENVQMGNYLVKSLRPKHEPISYQISEANLFEISVNFYIIYGIVQ